MFQFSIFFISSNFDNSLFVFGQNEEMKRKSKINELNEEKINKQQPTATKPTQMSAEWRNEILCNNETTSRMIEWK